MSIINGAAGDDSFPRNVTRCLEKMYLYMHMLHVIRQFESKFSCSTTIYKVRIWYVLQIQVKDDQ